MVERRTKLDVAMRDRPNPWAEFSLADGRGVLEADAAYIDAFNATAKTADQRLITTAWPQPWAGDLSQARVLVLGGNPGWSPADRTWDRKLAPLLAENLSAVRPIFWLDKAAARSPGGTWVRERLLANVLAELPVEVVQAAVAMVEFHGYHSVRWAPLPVTLPSQWYSFDRVRERLADGAVVVILRAAQQWKVAVPELIGHPNVLTTRSVQNVRLSPKNLSDDGWKQLMAPLYGVHRIWFGG